MADLLSDTLLARDAENSLRLETLSFPDTPSKAREFIIKAAGRNCSFELAKKETFRHLAEDFLAEALRLDKKRKH